jgi:hypothetical protein
MIDLIWQELNTPSGQRGPMSAAYARGASGVWHGVLGAAVVAFLGVWGLAAAVPLALVYWLVKEKGDLARGGSILDGLEDAVMVSLGAWYGAVWWPLMICGCGVYIMAAGAWRAR